MLISPPVEEMSDNESFDNNTTNNNEISVVSAVHFFYGGCSAQFLATFSTNFITISIITYVLFNTFITTIVPKLSKFFSVRALKSPFAGG